jgi:mercuric ion transport protein
MSDCCAGGVCALTGTIFVAVRCFTPLLVILFGIAGLSAFTPYLDYVLFPALTASLVVTGLSYGRWRRSCRHSESSVC